VKIGISKLFILSLCQKSWELWFFMISYWEEVVSEAGSLSFLYTHQINQSLFLFYCSDFRSQVTQIKCHESSHIFLFFTNFMLNIFNW